MRSASSREEQFPGAHELGAEGALERNAEKAYSFQLASTRERPDVNPTQPTRFDQLGDRRLRFCVVTGDEDIERLTGHRPGVLPPAPLPPGRRHPPGHGSPA